MTIASLNKPSFRGKLWALKDIQTEARGTDVPQAVIDVAARRGIEDVAGWLKPSFKKFMPDPYRLKCMEQAVSLCREYIRAGRKIVVYGDYDVDGATSSAILCRYFRMIDFENWEYYIPDRLKEGYGPNADAIKRLRDKGGELLIVVDSGTTAFAPLQVAVEVGFEVIVIDHHQAEERLPVDIVVNPKRLDEAGEFTYLCTAGLAFLFVVGLNRLLRDEGFFNDSGEPDLMCLLGIVALGTVADVVPLVDLNRAFVKIGLQFIPMNTGLRALMDATSETTLTAKSCGFVLGPCINAAGRIDDTMLGTRLLLCEDETEAKDQAARLVELNQERRKLQDEVVSDALRLADIDDGNSVLVVSNEAYHPGLIGLAASRLKDTFDRPAVVIGQDGKGSARSVEGFDVGSSILRAVAKGLLIKGGGHAMAGGLTIDPEKIDQLRSHLHEGMSQVARPPLVADLAMSCDEVSPELVDQLKMVEPFGAANPEPKVILFGGKVQSVISIKEKHVKVIISGSENEVDAIIWNGIGTAMGDALLAAEGRRVDLYGKLGTNTFRNVTKVVVFPEDISFA